MTNPRDEITYHDSNFMVELAKHLGLESSNITEMSATGDGGPMVTVTWSGYAVIDIEDFNKILESVDIEKVSRSSE
jgi:hypothetical protein